MVSTRVLCLLILVASAAAQDNGNQNDLTQNGGGQNGGTQNEPDQNGAQGQGNGVTTTTTVASGGVSICADSSGNLTPASTACSNVIADAACAAVFTPIAGTDASRDPKCMSSDTYYQNLAKQCMKTCGMCCTMPNYSCTDKPSL
ncbi:hypothetical protein QR680_017217 [Steinernema hermaphroditum]|uniref:ShKT domain-containing protein n=1 Tax=Steinernema hermaphroditum TaxID=289476 RepID=A0AA39HDS7_9BILA|nr:hypothetical protein QR680_017217 [Steinernema hermaphroditum]